MYQKRKSPTTQALKESITAIKPLKKKGTANVSNQIKNVEPKNVKSEDIIERISSQHDFYSKYFPCEHWVRTPDWLHRNKSLVWSDKYLLGLFLYELSNFKRPMRFLTKTLAGAIFTSERTVYRSIKRLKKKGLLILVRYNGVNGRWLIPNVEQIKLLMD